MLMRTLAARPVRKNILEHAFCIQMYVYIHIHICYYLGMWGLLCECVHYKNIYQNGIFGRLRLKTKEYKSGFPPHPQWITY